MVKVSFIYDEVEHKWEVEVSGATSELEALQAFNAVVITAMDAIPRVDCNKATKKSGWKLRNFHRSNGLKMK